MLYVFDRGGKVLKEIAAGASSYTVSHGGEIYALSQESRQGNGETAAANGKIAVYSLEGNKEREIKLEDCSYKSSDERGNEYPPQICVDSKGRMSILYPNTVIKLLDSKGSVEKELETTANLFLESDTEGSLITGQYYVRSQVSVADVIKLDAQNNQKWKAQLYSQAVAKSPTVRGEYLYFMDEKGVQRIDRDGKEI